mmetsp:Transcript_37506/g.88125  ORF Transcript_37506/g.88125 Transcript_37506/m.88125 type:complete len:175 (+) Transcript_37506:52-576(+)
MPSRNALHSAFLPTVEQPVEAGVPVSADDFLFRGPPARVLHEGPAQVETLTTAIHKAGRRSHPSEFLETPVASANHASGEIAAFRETGAPSPSELRIQEAGLLPHSLGEHGLGVLKALKTTVLLTGGLCSKLFGIGLMGYLAFQSMQANVSRSRQEQQMQGQYYNACGRRQDRA